LLERWITQNFDLLTPPDKKLLIDFCHQETSNTDVVSPKFSNLYLLLTTDPYRLPPPRESITITTPSKGEFLSVSFWILGRPEKEIAEQLSRAEYRLYSMIKPREFVGLSWSKTKRKSLAQNLIRFINHSTHISLWVGFSILCQSTVRDRVYLICKFLEITSHLISVNSNLSTSFSIIVGLVSSPIARLKSTWSALPSNYSEMFDHYRNLTTPAKNYGVLRKLQEEKISIPFVGMYLTDLTYLEELPDYTENKINWRKQLTIAEITRKILKGQEHPENWRFSPTPISKFLLCLAINKNIDESLYQLSLVREPRTTKLPPLPVVVM